MARNKRKNENTNQLLSCFVTPKEKALILKAIPEGVSMSSFLRSIIMLEVKLRLIKLEKNSKLSSEKIEEDNDITNDSNKKSNEKIKN